MPLACLALRINEPFSLLVLRPGFEGQCACEIRVLPRLEMEVDEAQALLLEQWRQPSEVKAKSLNLKP